MPDVIPFRSDATRLSECALATPRSVRSGNDVGADAPHQPDRIGAMAVVGLDVIDPLEIVPALRERLIRYARLLEATSATYTLRGRRARLRGLGRCARCCSSPALVWCAMVASQYRAGMGVSVRRVRDPGRHGRSRSDRGGRHREYRKRPQSPAGRRAPHQRSEFCGAVVFPTWEIPLANLAGLTVPGSRGAAGLSVETHQDPENGIAHSWRPCPTAGHAPASGRLTGRASGDPDKKDAGFGGSGPAGRVRLQAPRA